MELFAIPQKLISDVGQLGFTQVPVKGWIIYMDEHGHLDDPGHAVHLSVYNGETVHIYWVSFGLAVMVDRG